MTYPVTIQLKKRFLRWFQERYTINNYEIDWFMEELLDDEQILFHLYFVDQIEYCPKGIIMTVHEGCFKSFCFFKDHITTNDVYTAYHELQLYRHEPMYIQVQFIEEDPPFEYTEIIENEQSHDYNIKETSNELLEYLLTTGKDEFIKEAIDTALEQRDMQRLKHLTMLLQMKK